MFPRENMKGAEESEAIGRLRDLHGLREEESGGTTREKLRVAMKSVMWGGVSLHERL